VTRETLEHRLQQDVLSLVSHKFRTPLTVIALWTKLMQDGECGVLTEPQVEALGAMGNASNELRALLEGMLSFVEWSKHLHSLHRSRAGFAELETAVRERVRDLAGPDQGFAVERDGHGEVFVDLALFSEVLVELVRNAFKFGGPQVQVRVEMRWRNEKAVFAVSDTGPGIPPEETERVFERFYQIDGDFTGQVRGVGLGLALVKAAVEALGGVIRVQSRLQQGTRFEISF